MIHRSYRVRGVAATLLVLSFVLWTDARANPDPLTITASADPQGFQYSLDVVPNVPFMVYVVAHGLGAPIEAFQFSLGGVPLGTTFALSTTYFGADPSNAGNAATYDYLVSTGECAETDVFTTLVAVQFLSVVAPAADTALTPMAVDGGAVPSGLGVVTCGDDPGPVDLTLLRVTSSIYPDGSLILNATGWICPTEESCFGAFKARF